MGGGQSRPLGPNGINSAYSLILPNSLQKISKLPQPKVPLPSQTKKSPISRGVSDRVAGRFLRRSGPEQPENKFFVLFWGTPKWTKKVVKGPQVGGMYDPMSWLENKLLTESIGPFL
jgi:hypothetical protein